MGSIKKANYSGMYIEPDKEVALHWIDYFHRRGIFLTRAYDKNFDLPEIPRNERDGSDFFLIDEQIILKEQVNILLKLIGSKPLFVISDFVTLELMDRCLELRAMACLDRHQALEVTVSRIIGLLTAPVNASHLDDYAWPTWQDVRETEDIGHPSDLGDHDLLERVFIREFLRAEGNMSKVSRNMGVTRITARKYYERFNRTILSMLVRGHKKDRLSSLNESRREIFIKVLRKKWFYADFQNFIKIYGPDIETVAKVLNTPVDLLRDFMGFWDDIIQL